MCIVSRATLVNMYYKHSDLVSRAIIGKHLEQFAFKYCIESRLLKGV